jgi:hypothetical protein
MSDTKAPSTRPEPLEAKLRRAVGAAFPEYDVVAGWLDPPFVTFDIRDIDTLPERLSQVREALSEQFRGPDGHEARGQINAFIGYAQLRGAYVVSLHAVAVPGVMPDV